MTKEVSLDITSKSLSLLEIERVLMLKGDPASRSRGDVIPAGRLASITVLRIEPKLGKHASLQDQLDAIIARMPAARLRAANLDVEVTFNIAVYFDTACVTTLVDARLVALIHEYSAAIAVVAYPVSE